MPTNQDIQKKRMIQAMRKHLGNVTKCTDIVGIARSTHYDWMNSDPAYKAEIENIDDIVLDFVENKLYEKIEGGDTTAIIFQLKCKGKKRGYIERSQTEITINKPGIAINFGAE
jgi:hypothetical protein